MSNNVSQLRLRQWSPKHNFEGMVRMNMSYSCFAKEIQNYTRACEHLISESMREAHQFTEDELDLVKYYTDEVVRTIIGNRSHVSSHELAE
jgi:hypothetical protein